MENVMPDYNLGQLDKIEHIVVLMLENRSFDHILGFLSLPESLGGRGRSEVDGLKNLDDYVNEYAGKRYKPQPLADEHLSFKWDPCHEFKCVQKQLENNNGGFVENFARHHHRTVKDVELKDPGLIMGYYTATQLPTFDKLADQFCVCDRWFSSLPGPTVPNRLYSIAGTSEGHLNNPTLVPLTKYEFNTVFDYLPKDVSWKYYKHDVAALWFFPKYIKKTMTKVVTFADDPVDGIGNFFKRAKKGNLPAVSWIDPDFASLVGYSQTGNDDHPPSNMQKGQALVREIYNALLKSKVWNKTLFVVTYDEHGGFYDHVQPPAAEDDWPHLRKYGVRVPTLVISPWVGKQAVSHAVFDHASLVKTILLRFCRDENGGIPHLSKRVDTATPLSVLLTEKRARKDCLTVPAFRAGFEEPFDAEPTELQILMKTLYEDTARHRGA
jgi:phospholipase C